MAPDTAAAPPAVPPVPLSPARRTALLRALPPDTAASARAAVAATAGTDLPALQAALLVRCIGLTTSDQDVRAAFAHVFYCH